jgi:hypothetical protein
MTQGLLVQFPGFKIVFPQECDEETPSPHPTTLTFRLLTRQAKWFNMVFDDEEIPISSSHLRTWNANGRMCVILNSLPSQNWVAGLLVRTCAKLRRGEIYHVKRLCRVFVHSELDVDVVKSLEDNFAVHRNFKRGLAQELPNYQQWCISETSNDQSLSKL